MASNWKELQESMRDIPQAPGCYVIIMDGRAGYVGQTGNLSARLFSYQIRMGYANNFHCIFGTFKSIRVKYRVSRAYGDWAMIELRLIRRLRPEFNCVGGQRLRKNGAIGG